MTSESDRHELAEELVLPPGLDYVRTTPIFTKESTPAGLLGSHQVAANTWAVLAVRRGRLTFAFDETGDRRVVGRGATQVIPPLRPHRVIIEDEVEFEIAFYRIAGGR